MEGRLVVLLFALALVPAYFILFFMFIKIDFTILGDIAILFIIFINPWIYILSWELWLLLFGTRIANSYERMKNIVSFVSIRYNLYYGLTALSFVFAFVFPLITPLVSSLVIGSIVWRLTTSRHDWERNEKTPAWVIIIVILVMIVPIACNIYFYVEFIPQTIEFWDNVYIGIIIPPLRNIAKALATAVTLGSVIYLFMYGTSEYELVIGEGKRPREITYIRVLQVLLFGFFLFLVYTNSLLFTIIQYFVIFMNVLIILGNLRKSRQIKGVRKSVVSYLLITALFIFSVLNNVIVENIILIFSSLLYIITFLAIFITTGED